MKNILKSIASMVVVFAIFLLMIATILLLPLNQSHKELWIPILISVSGCCATFVINLNKKSLIITLILLLLINCFINYVIIFDKNTITKKTDNDTNDTSSWKSTGEGGYVNDHTKLKPTDWFSLAGYETCISSVSGDNIIELENRNTGKISVLIYKHDENRLYTESGEPINQKKFNMELDESDRIRFRPLDNQPFKVFLKRP